MKPHDEAADDAFAVKPLLTLDPSGKNCLVERVPNAARNLYMDLFTVLDGITEHCFRPKHSVEHVRREKRWPHDVASTEM